MPHKTRSRICPHKDCGASVLVLDGVIATHKYGGDRKSSVCLMSGRRG